MPAEKPPATVLRTPARWRITMSVAALAPISGLIFMLGKVLSSDYAWTGLSAATFAVTVLTGICAVIGVTVVMTAALWVDLDDELTLHQRFLGIDATRALTRPATVQFTYTEATRGATSGTWKVTVRRVGMPPLTVATPWLGTVHDLATLLQPVLRRNVDLAYDDLSFDIMSTPSAVAGPSPSPDTVVAFLAASKRAA